KTPVGNFLCDGLEVVRVKMDRLDVEADPLERCSMPCLQNDLTLAALEPWWQMCICNDVGRGRQGLVPFSTPQRHWLCGGWKGDLPVPDHPQVLDIGPAASQLFMKGPRAVGVLPAGKAVVQNSTLERLPTQPWVHG